MVLTPDFRLSQTDSQVLIYINIPNVRVSGMELTVLPDMDFSFYCRPYLLRLQLPGQVHDEDDPDETKRPRATYDPNTSNGLLTVNLSKRNAGEQFEGLDMITTLLKAGSVRPRTGTGRHGLGVDGEGAYGFLNGFKNFFGDDGFLQEFPDLVDLPHPDNTSMETRRILRVLHEDAMFSCERYRSDLFGAGEDELYVAAMRFQPTWTLDVGDSELNISLQSLSLKDARPVNPDDPIETMTVSQQLLVSEPKQPEASQDSGVLSSADDESVALDMPAKVKGSDSVDCATPKGDNLALPDASPAFSFGTASSSHPPMTFDFGSQSPSLNHSGFSFGSASPIRPTFSFAATSPGMESFSFGKPGIMESKGSEESKPVLPHTAKRFFDETESRQLALLSNREFDPHDDIVKRAYLKVIDVLLAYCHEHRMTQGEFTVESHWTVRKLSSTLTWLEDFSTLDQVVSSFARRAICFPYLRRWDLTCRAAEDCACLLERGGKYVVKALLRIQRMFTQSQTAHLLNKLFVDDMIVFAQTKLFNRTITAHGVPTALRKVFDIRLRIPPKALVGWNLAKSSSSRSVDPEVLKTSHLIGVVQPRNPHPLPSNVLEELD